MVLNNVVCPVSTEQIDSNVSRTTVFLCVLLMTVFMITLNPIFMGIVFLDYLIRSTGNIKISPLRLIAIGILSPFKLQPCLTGKAPKMFASRLAVLCAGGSVVLILLDMTTASIIVGGMLLVLAFMDAVLNFCVGCLIYNFVVYPFYKKSK